MVVVGIALILFYKLFFGTDDERKGCWQNVFIVVLAIIGLGFYIGYKFDEGRQRPDGTYTDSPPATPPSGGKAFGFYSEIADPATCANYGLTYTGNSLLVNSVAPGSGAQRAQLPTSVIVEVDGLAPDSVPLTAVKARHKVGDMVPFKLVTPDGRWWNYWIQLGTE